jgi:hypothetical protein
MLTSCTGFSFSGEVREPFPAVIQAMEETKLPVLSVDAPSSWNVDEGPPPSGLGSKFRPAVLISLTAPKPLVKHFQGRHFVGGRRVLTLFTVSTTTLTVCTDSYHRLSPRSMTSMFPTIQASIRSSSCPPAERSCKGVSMSTSQVPPKQLRTSVR